MPCHRIPGFGVLCVGNEPVEIRFNNRTYLFEWTAGCGWLPCNEDGSERLSPVPEGAWEKLLKIHGKTTEDTEKRRSDG